jgi:bacterioferritin (cytochrome b1)
MKGSPDIIKVLNEVLRKELTGINQYFMRRLVVPPRARRARRTRPSGART